MWLPWLITAGLLLISTFLFVRVRWRRYFEFTRNLDGPPSFPLIGSALIFAGKALKENFIVLVNLCKTYTAPFVMWLGPTLIVFVTDPKDLDIVYNSPDCIEKAFFYKFFDCPKGLVTSPANTWKVHRRLLNPSFNMKILRSFIPIFNEKTQILANNIELQVNKEAFCIYEYMSRCFLSMICVTTLGTNLNNVDDIIESGATSKAMEMYMEKLTLRMFKFWHYFDFIYKFSEDHHIWKTSKAKAIELPRKIIELKKNEVNQNKGINRNKEIIEESVNSEDTEEYRKPQIFIDQLFKLSQETDVIDDNAIRDEIDTMIAAGTETSSGSLSHVILFLAMHQDIQEKVVDELRTVYYDADEVTDADTLSKLVYTEMVIKEGMRLMPIVPFMIRTAMEDIPIATNNMVLPAGVLILIPAYHVHRDPQHWGPNADEFDPEHFSEEAVAGRHPYAYMPFSAGPRNCIGFQYAMIAMKIILSKLLRCYKFQTTYTMDTIVKKCQFTLKLDHKHAVTVEKRKF